MANKWYLKGAHLFAQGALIFGTTDVRCLLVDSGYVFSDAHDFVDDVVAEELVGTGYVRKALTGEAINSDAPNNRIELDCDNITWVAIDAGIAAAMIVYGEGGGTDATRPLYAFIDSGFPKTTNGGDLTAVVNAEGLLQADPV